MKYAFLFLLISLVLLGCKDKIGDAHIEGYVTNLATGDPVQDLDVSLYELLGWTSSITISVKTTDSIGYFLFDGNYQDYGQSLYIDLENIHNNYQTQALVNGEVKFVNLWAINPDGHSSEPQTYNIGLYPITSFRIIVTNIPPAHSDDIININIQNVRNGTIWKYEYIGAVQNKVISGYTNFGNELILDYDVTSNEVVTSYQKIFECTPGEETTFELNY